MRERDVGLKSKKDKPIFIQGLFRSRTTFVASEFGHDPENKLFNEPLHPLFGERRQQREAPKSLRHPPLEEGFLAELPTNIESPIDLGVKRYFLKPDEEEPELENYFSKLINTSSGRPVFKLVRMPLRGEWLANKFPGVHVYVDRDLSGLVNSYYSYHGRFSWYLSEFVTIAGANADNPVFARLAEFMGLKKTDGNYFYLKDYYRRLTYQKFREGQFGKQTMVDMVAFFSELAFSQASRYADVIITSEDLRNPDKRKLIAEDLTQLSGSDINFSNFKDKYPKLEIAPSEEVLEIINDAKRKS